MADEPTTPAPVEDQAPAASTEPTTTSEPAAPTSETNGEAPIAKEDEEIAGKQATTEVTAPTGEEKTEAAEGPTDPDASAATPASSKKGSRKSTGGVPEHKKKLNKKKSMPTLNLDCKPGDYYWARLKGYPPWPAVICDEEMLPETLLASRPVSTTRPDGTIRDDFKEGGKNAKERTWPVMFMATNEFVWLVNTALTKLEPEECNTMPTKKMTKALQMAYKVASEGHDISYFKGLLKDFEEEQKRFNEEAKAAEAAEEEKAAKKAEKEAKAIEDGAKAGDDKKKKARKSKGGDGDDVDMGDAEATKPSKKRKKDADSSDAEGGKPQKTPKVTKLNAPKTPNGASTSKKSSKPKKTVSAPKVEEEAGEDKTQMSEEEKFAHQRKAVLYLRHKLQKGFLSRDEAPKDEAMAEMSEFLTQLENHKELDSAIIKYTKIHKVLKGIVKLDTIPKESEYDFKKRSHAMLDIWSKRMDAEAGDGAAKESAEPKSEPPQEKLAEEKPDAQTNGDTDMKDAADGEAKEGAEQKDEDIKEDAIKKANEVDEKVEDAKAPEGVAEVEKKAEEQVKVDEKAEKEGEDEKKDDVEEPAAAPVEKTESGIDAKDEADGEGDVSMQTAPEENTEVA